MQSSVWGGGAPCCRGVVLSCKTTGDCESAFAAAGVTEACQPLPPVHLLHQVRTYQKACPVEAMRAVNTFRGKKIKCKPFKKSLHHNIYHFLFLKKKKQGYIIHKRLNCVFISISHSLPTLFGSARPRLNLCSINLIWHIMSESPLF